MYHKLKRHIIKAHNDKPEVAAVIDAPDSKEANREFSKIRKEGTYMYNKEKCHDQQDIREQRVHCKICKGSYSRVYFYRHKRKCQDENQPSTLSTAISVSLLAEDPVFSEILQSFHADEAGNLCRQDATIKLIGKHIFAKDKTKVEKTQEVRKNVMACMRNLANLYRIHQAETGVLWDLHRWRCIYHIW